MRGCAISGETVEFRVAASRIFLWKYHRRVRQCIARRNRKCSVCESEISHVTRRDTMAMATDRIHEFRES